jgi:hypothetical protein
MRITETFGCLSPGAGMPWGYLKFPIEICPKHEPEK